MIDGAQRFRSIQIDPLVVNPENIDGFQEKLLKGINGAIVASQSMAAEKMKKMTGLNIPGF